MAGNKKAKDFQKVRLKVGKIKKKGLNFTETSFKSKKIIIREQLKGEVKGTREQFALALQKIASSNPSNVTDGLNTIVRILELLSPEQRQTLIPKLGVLTSRLEISVRDGSTSVLNRTLERFAPEQKKGFAAKLLINLECAMTNLDWGVKRSSLQLLEVLLRHTPEEVAGSPSVIENLMDLVSSTREGTFVRKLDMELKCSSDHLRLWRDVTRVLTRLVQCIVKTFFAGGKPTVRTCTGATVVPRICWMATGIRRVVAQRDGGILACAFVPVLLSMWSGIENCTTAKTLLKQDLFAHVSTAMLRIVEWADLSKSATTSGLQALGADVTNFFKSRFPVSTETSACAETNLRLGKLMILLNDGKDQALNQALFHELKKHDALSDPKLTLDVAALAVKDTPGVLEYVNSLFFVKKAQARRPFYKFYLGVVEARISEPHLDKMLYKVAAFVSKIIILYPDDCEDEVRFLEKLHSYMIPAYIRGISKLPFSVLDQVLRCTHTRGPLGLRLILDQKLLSHEHLRIIGDHWNDGGLSQDDMIFVMGHLAWKIEEIHNSMVSDPTSVPFIDLHIQMVQLVAEFIVGIFLDLDSDENPRFSRTAASHPQQRHLHYFEQIHNHVLFLNADCRASRARLDGVISTIVLRDDFLRDTVIDLLRELLQIWNQCTDSPLTLSAVTLGNTLHLLKAALDFDDDSLTGIVDKLINQLFVSQFLLPTQEQDADLIRTCVAYYQQSGPASMLQDLERVMKSKREECDDRLHAAFAKSIKFFLEQQLIPKETCYQDLVDDAMKIADGSDESSDSVGDSSA